MQSLAEYFPFISPKNSTVYLDSAATSQCLYTVIEDQQKFEMFHRANAHRSGHKMGTWVDQQYHLAKELIGEFLNIENPNDRIVFTSGATQALNDAARMIEQKYRRATIYVSADFHHSLYLPFTKLTKTSFFNIELIDIDEHGDLNLAYLESKLQNDTNPKVIAVSAVSNVLGRVNDLEQVKLLANKYKATTVIDASQIISKRTVDLSGFDFVAWSWHKIYGPMGLGCLVIGENWIEEEPTRPGGGSITSVSVNEVSWQTSAARFESGTQNLSAISTLPRLLRWLIKHQHDIQEHDMALAKFANRHVSLNQFRPASQSQTSLISLSPTVGAVEDYAYMLDAKNIMVRTGKLCAEPLLTKLGVNGLVRLSWAAYTTTRDLELAFDALGEIHGRISRHVR